MSKTSLTYKQSCKHFKHLKKAHFPVHQSKAGQRWVYRIVRWMMDEEERMKETKVEFT